MRNINGHTTGIDDTTLNVDDFFYKKRQEKRGTTQRFVTDSNRSTEFEANSNYQPNRQFSERRDETALYEKEDIAYQNQEEPIASSTMEIYSSSQTQEEELPLLHHPTSQIHVKAVRISRIHFLRTLLSDLLEIRKHSGTTLAAPYVKDLLNTARTIRDLLQSDPFSEVVMALHDSLAFENRWFEYSDLQYKKAYDLLKKLGQKKSISVDLVDRSIMELENIGFQTTPFADAHD